MNRGLPLNRRLDGAARRGLALVGGLLLGLSLFFLAGCETLEKRLERNQGLLNTLPPEHQSLIQQGRIQVGFTPSEVYLAWGAPTHKAITESAEGRQEIWSYTTTQTETYYREERYYDWEFDSWRFIDRPIYRYLEYLYREAIFSEGALTSFTLYPNSQPYLNGQSRP